MDEVWWQSAEVVVTALKEALEYLCMSETALGGEINVLFGYKASQSYVPRWF